jgi:uncharacterized membrane protein YfcA
VEWWLGYLCLGAVVGFFAGLLGIGGGLIMVPVLSFFFSAQGFPPDHIIHLALGTSMAAIIFTSISSLRVHHINGAVNWHIVKFVTPGVIFGTFCGVILANSLSGRYLSIFIILFIYYAATRMLINNATKPNRQLPGKAGMFTVGTFIGGVSSLVAIGGGILTVPFLSACNVRLQHAIGTAAAIGFPIAIAGTIGYIASGIVQSQMLPEYSLGYVYLPALAGIVVFSLVTASIGAKVTHTTQTATIRKIFVMLLYVLGTKMLTELF